MSEEKINRGRIIDVNTANLQTASVEIRSLIVSGKQMTLSVFRQLPIGHVYNRDSLDMIGNPWGRINYFWKECDGKLHIVFEKDGDLFRDIIGYRELNSMNQERLKGVFLSAENNAIKRISDAKKKLSWLEGRVISEREKSECENIIIEEEKIISKLREDYAKTCFNAKKRDELESELFGFLCALPQLFIAI